MLAKQNHLDPAERDYGYIEYFRKSVESHLKNPSDAYSLGGLIEFIHYNEAERDYYNPSLRQINHLIQIDQKPNLELMEPKWELYKISLSFSYLPPCKFPRKCVTLCIKL